ncbi:hypothetical protein N9A94_06590 [Akkermansiaceae bacterium]|nr:hypothetical protein [Akkermansiaceae bacterium]MDA7888646.1 hypothetical protein [Akkermansiaceae bacterium]
MRDQEMPISIEALTSSAKDRRRFVQLQFSLYQDAPLWVPPLIRDELHALNPAANPGLEDCELRLWLAMRDGKCVGRIAGVINQRDNKLRDLKAARFCLLDFIDDEQVAQALLNAVQTWAIEKEMTLLEGPLGLTTFERSAVLIEGFDRLPTVVSSYNFPYYAAHIESCGFAKEIDYLEHRFQLPPELDPKYRKVAQYVLKKKGLRLIDKKSRRELRPFGREIFQLINAAYSDLYEFTPMNEREIDALINKFFSFIDTRFVKVVVDEHDAIVAIGIAMPSWSTLMQKLRGKLWRLLLVILRRELKGSNDTLDLYLVAVAPKLRNAGLHAIVMQEMHQSAVTAGFKWVETNGELETNTQVLSLWKDIDHETHKRRRIYSKRLK